MFYILLFTFFSLLPKNITFDQLKNKYETDYKYYLLEKNGSILNDISKKHLLLCGTIFGMTAYQTFKYKKEFSIDQLPHLFLSVSTAYLGEQFCQYFENQQKEKARQNTSNNYTFLEKSFRILEKKNSLEEEDFIQELYNKHSDNEGKEFYEKINKTVLEKTNNFIVPKKIKEDEALRTLNAEKIKKEIEALDLRKQAEQEGLKQENLTWVNEENQKKELQVLNIKEKKLHIETAELEQKKIQAELEDKHLIKTFMFEEYSKEKTTKALCGWGNYFTEKAKVISEKQKENQPCKSNVLLYGAPGCGKTSYVENFTKAIATELQKNVIFYNIKNDDLKGQSENSGILFIAQLFEQINKQAEENMVVAFFDEFDGISTQREEQKGENEKINHQNNSITTSLLQKIEEAHNKKNIVILAATNCIGNIDEGLKRPGRFDRTIRIGKPNIDMRKEIIENTSNSFDENELLMLLYLTSEQSSVEVVNTVNQYLEFSKNAQKKEKNLVESFFKTAINIQKMRNSSSSQSLNNEEIKELERLEKEVLDDYFKNMSLKNLKLKEQTNKEIVSLDAIRQQEQFPTIRCHIEGLLKGEKTKGNNSLQQISSTLETMVHILESKKDLRALEEFQDIQAQQYYVLIKHQLENQFEILSTEVRMEKIKRRCDLFEKSYWGKTEVEEKDAQYKEIFMKLIHILTINFTGFELENIFNDILDTEPDQYTLTRNIDTEIHKVQTLLKNDLQNTNPQLSKNILVKVRTLLRKNGTRESNSEIMAQAQYSRPVKNYKTLLALFITASKRVILRLAAKSENQSEETNFLFYLLHLIKNNIDISAVCDEIKNKTTILKDSVDIKKIYSEDGICTYIDYENQLEEFKEFLRKAKLDNNEMKNAENPSTLHIIPDDRSRQSYQEKYYKLNLKFITNFFEEENSYLKEDSEDSEIENLNVRA